MTPSFDQLLLQRRSLRSFSDRPIERQVLDRMFEAARWASSAYNEQPWGYVVLDDPSSETRARVLDSMEPHNRAWAEKAPVILASVAQLGFRGRDGVNRHAHHDVGQANAHLALRAAELGLTVHMIGGFNHQAAGEALGLAAGFEVVALMAVAYPGPPEVLPEPLRIKETAPRVRREIGEFVRFG
ncbi:nitroreductase family protein [Magnetospirillum sp. 15-1]|uniref:nitroreductase family protein n=1 Tax=Magnetospirillum sp. 15-1 TaxID=1979370 RepID=UPI000BBCAC69|nr:nitroreductase family protein [Magnetospirillum sp. 15-1]